MRTVEELARIAALIARLEVAVPTLLLTTVVSVSCGGGFAVTSKPTTSIGAAKMDKDGTIVLTLRAEGEGGAIGDAQISYRPGDPQYQAVLDHVGGLTPGVEKPVPPWSDE